VPHIAEVAVIDGVEIEGNVVIFVFLFVNRRLYSLKRENKFIEQLAELLHYHA
jgi:hypothetical protein